MFHLPEQIAGHLQMVDSTYLTTLVRQSLGRSMASVTEWDSRPLQGGIGGGLGGTLIYRFSGQADDNGASLPWSLILKILIARPDEDPAGSHYWKREALAYRTGLLADLPGDLFAARCYQVVDFGDEACGLWLEEVTEMVGRHWPVEHYGVVGRHFGLFNGAYLAGRAVSSAPWLSSDWFRKMLAMFQPQVSTIIDSLSSPLLRTIVPQAVGDQIMALWEARETFLGHLDGLPQTFCHLDGFRRNLFAQRTSEGRDQTVAIDWAFPGIAAVGAEIAVTVIIGLWFMEIEASDVEALESILFGAYLDGLSEAGWHGDPSLVRLGYCAAVVVKNFEPMQVIPMLIDESHAGSVEQMTGRSQQDCLAQCAEIFRFVLRRASEAIELAGG